MGGIGSGRKPKRETLKDFKPAREKKTEPAPGTRLYSVPKHVDKIKTSGACRFQG